MRIGTIWVNDTGTWQMYPFGWVKIGMQGTILRPYAMTAADAKRLGYWLAV